MANIVILIGSHLCTAPRPQKEARALTAAGHKVKILGVWYNAELARHDEQLKTRCDLSFAPVVDCRNENPRGRVSRLRHRLFCRMARELLRRGGLFSPEVCGYGARQLLAAARRERADLTIIHAESGLWIGTRLVRDGLGVGVDFEDWFSEDIGEGDPLAGRARALKGFEAKLLQTCRYRLATSHAMARALAAEHAVTPPMVIYNSFPRLECSRFNSAPRDRHDLSLPSLTWFSQTIGEFRGLEDLFAALPLLKQKCEIHLRGSIRPETRERFLGLCPAEWRVHLFFHPTVASEELPARIAEHDIGLALERRRPRSRNLTITNKLFQYMQAGLAIVATSTEGQVEAMSRAPGAGLLTEEGPKGLADGLNQRLTDKIALHRAKELSKQAFEREFAWELHEPDLRNHLEEGLKPA